MDWRFTLIGIAMIAIGVALSLIFINIANMAEVEEYAQNRMVAQGGGIIAGLGVMILLISFFLQRGRRRFKKI
jgi:3-dehydroquinate dehydratase